MDGWGAAPRLPLPPGRLFPSAQSVQPRPQWETAVVPPGQPLQQCCPGCGVSGNVASEAGRTGYGVMELMYGRHECGASWTSTRVPQGVGCAGLMIVWLRQGRRDAQQIASESDVVPNCQGAFSLGKSGETEVGHAAEANVVVQMQPNLAARVPHGGGHVECTGGLYKPMCVQHVHRDVHRSLINPCGFNTHTGIISIVHKFLSVNPRVFSMHTESAYTVRR